MTPGEKRLIAAHDKLLEIGARIPASRPPELPPESDPAFWPTAARLEVETRGAVSQIAARLASSPEPCPMTALEAWFVGRRLQWAAQILLAKARLGAAPPADVPPDRMLTDLLVRSWDTDGCIAFWNHAVERGGQPHPGNPDGLTPPPET